MDTGKSFFVHEKAIVEDGAKIGDHTRVWAFTHVLPGAVIGQDCNLCDLVFIENDVLIGDRVTVKCGVQLWDGICLEDDVFLGPNVTFTNDLFPRSKQYPEKFARTVVQKGASIGANATILPGIIIGAGSMVGAGAVVTRNVPPNAIVVGNPARISGYVGVDKSHSLAATKVSASIEHLKVPTVRVIEMPIITDLRGSLVFGEYSKHLPFDPKRFFVIFDVPTIEVRGEHAHKVQHQILVCLKGTCSVVVDDGKNRDEILLDQPNLGLHIPPMIWAIQYKYSPDAVLLVLASDIYDADDYIRRYEDYLDLVGSNQPGEEPGNPHVEGGRRGDENPYTFE